MDEEKSTPGRTYTYRPPKKLAARFEARVRASNLKVNAFITQCVFGGSRAQRIEPAAVALALADIAKLKDVVRGLAGDGEAEAAAQACARELVLIRTMLMQALGRTR